MANDPVTHSSLEKKMLEALEAPPRVTIPPGFAARVAGNLPDRPAIELKSRRYGLGAAMFCLALLVAVMPLVAKAAAAGAVYNVAAETLLYLQFVCLVVWLVFRKAGYGQWSTGRDGRYS